MRFSVSPKMNRRKLGLRGLQCFLIITALIVFTITKLYLEHLPISNLQFWVDSQPKMLVPEKGKTAREADSHIQAQPIKPICHFSTYDYCNMSGDIRVHGKSSTVFVSVTDGTTGNSSYTIWPYTQKKAGRALSSVREYTVKIIASSRSKQLVPRCTRNHSVAGIVFSISGYSGNIFHAFADVILPLYLTTREFNGEVEFLVTNKHTWWLNKFGVMLKKLSKYNITDIDAENGVHCFPELFVGLKRHKIFSIDSSLSPYSMIDFRNFLREAYGLKRLTAIQLKDGDARKPRLLIVSRKRTRCFMNEGDIVKLATGLGFEVIVMEADSNLTRFSRLVNSCDVMMGVHGAGLTNILFLPENAVFIQIVPLGGLEWVSKVDFGDPAKAMNLRYMDYKIGVEESSLIEEYPLDHQVLKDPSSVFKKGGWGSVKAVYMVKQNVKLDVERFRATLVEAKRLLHL